MVAYAQHEFELARPAGRDGKASLRDHLQAVERQTGRTPLELIGPELPAAGADWWAMWAELDRGRQIVPGAVAGVSWADLRAWSDLTGRVLEPSDVEALLAIDAAYVATMNKALREQRS